MLSQTNAYVHVLKRKVLMDLGFNKNGMPKADEFSNRRRDVASPCIAILPQQTRVMCECAFLSGQ